MGLFNHQNSIDYLHSNYISHRALKGLNKLGDVVIPKSQTLPSFSETNAIEYVDEVLEVTDPEDVTALNILLTVIHFLPAGFSKGLLKLSEQCERLPDWIGNPLRMVNIALRGIPLSLYYSGLQGSQAKGSNVLEIMEYELTCEPDYDFKNW